MVSARRPRIAEGNRRSIRPSRLSERVAPLGLTGPGGAFSWPSESLMCRSDVSIQAPDTAFTGKELECQMTFFNGELVFSRSPNDEQ